MFTVRLSADPQFPAESEFVNQTASVTITDDESKLNWNKLDHSESWASENC